MFEYEEPPERPADPAVRRAYLRRIVALFRPYRPRLGGVLGLIVFASVLGAVPAFLIKAASTPRCPGVRPAPAQPARRGDDRDRRRHGRARRRPDPALAPGRAARDARPAHRGLPPPAAPLAAFFTRTRTGEVQSRLANDIGGVQEVVTSTATSIVSNVTTVLATVVAMFLLDWRLTLFALALPRSSCG